MNMKSSEFLQHLMDKAKDNPNSLARKSNVPQSTIFRFVTGTSKEPRLSTLEKIARVYGVPVETFLNDQARRTYLFRDEEANELQDVGHPPPSSLVPVVSAAKLGDNGWYCETEAGTDGYVAHFSDDPDAYALLVKGDSMFPAIRSGWYVIVEPNHVPMGGEYVAVHLKNEKKMVKEFLFKTPDEIHLQSINGQERLTLQATDIISMHPVTAVVSPRKHKLLP